MKMIQLLFTFTADQEKQHAQIFYHHLKEFSGENINISSAAYPIDISEKLEDLLTFAQHNEYEEANNVYVTFSQNNFSLVEIK